MQQVGQYLVGVQAVAVGEGVDEKQALAQIP